MNNAINKAAKAMWYWENCGPRESEILDLEWNLLQADYMRKTKLTIKAFLDALDAGEIEDKIIDASYVDEDGNTAISSEDSVKTILSHLKTMCEG